MFENYKSQLIDWRDRTDDRQKLQTVYLLLIVASFVAAAILGLFSYHLGHKLLVVSVAAILVFAANAVVWALLQTFVIAKLPARKPRQR